jgi:predicted site-specific integrase-resolvase
VTDAPRLVSTAEAARALGLSSVTLSRWARQGRVKPAVATPGAERTTYRWDLDDLRHQLRGDQHGPDEQ